MYKSTTIASVYTVAFLVSMGISTALHAEPDVEEIEPPPPAVEGSTETKKMPDKWRIQRSTETPKKPKKEVPLPKIDRSDECHPTHGTRTREALGCD